MKHGSRIRTHLGRVRDKQTGERKLSAQEAALYQGLAVFAPVEGKLQQLDFRRIARLVTTGRAGEIVYFNEGLPVVDDAGKRWHGPLPRGTQLVLDRFLEGTQQAAYRVVET